MSNLGKEIMKKQHRAIQKELLVNPDPTVITLPLELKMKGDYSVTFTGLNLDTLKKMLDLEFEFPAADDKGKPKVVSVNPDRIWAQLRFVNDVDGRTKDIVTYIKKQSERPPEAIQSARVLESPKEDDALRNRAATDPRAKRPRKKKAEDHGIGTGNKIQYGHTELEEPRRTL